MTLSDVLETEENIGACKPVGANIQEESSIESKSLENH